MHCTIIRCKPVENSMGGGIMKVKLAKCPRPCDPLTDAPWRSSGDRPNEAISGSMMTVRLVRNHSHWGSFFAEVEHGRIVGVRPFEHDPDPSDLIQAIPDGVHSPARIADPMIRKGWREGGADTSAGRGREPFVPIAWDR